MEFIRFRIHDILELKKPHPCGSKQFEILRVGSDIRMICLGCHHDMVIDRIKLEKATKRIQHAEDEKGEANEY